MLCNRGRWPKIIVVSQGDTLTFLSLERKKSNKRKFNARLLHGKFKSKAALSGFTNYANSFG